ncbi:ketopantoate reductase family protein [Reichenbachiella versicolor]|uniref:ketopantoate reductase family protein n=1 Tax=Reichenbachiella versicolor TaxID=1821036 RepID=UPI000D6DFC8B|nr:2-dehydropantoate 2-reductase [Reichenbachiella versicolor]
MKIAVIGTGAIGSYYGVKLGLAGNDVTFISRGKTLSQIQQFGIKLQLPSDKLIHFSPIATDDMSRINDCELILITTKSWQVRNVASSISAHLHKHATILPLGNGIHTMEDLASSIPEEQILGGQCLIFCQKLKNGVIQCLSEKPLLTFGEFNKTISKRTMDIKKVFDTSNINSKLSKDIEADIWRKFMLVCTSALGAITHKDFGHLRIERNSRRIMIEIFMEINKLANSKGIYLGNDIVRKSLSIIDHIPEKASSSLSRDILNKKHSELEYQNGVVVRLGKMLGIPTPTNEKVYNIIKSISIPEHQLLLSPATQEYLLEGHIP